MSLNEILSGQPGDRPWSNLVVNSVNTLLVDTVDANVSGNLLIGGNVGITGNFYVGGTAGISRDLGVTGSVSCAKLFASSSIGNTSSPIPSIYLSNGGTGVTGLNYYETLKTTTTYTSAYASPIPATYNLSRIGNMVSLCLGATAGAVSGTPQSIGISTDLPSRFYPTDYVRVPIIVRNNGVDIVSRFECSPAGNMFIAIGTTGVSNVGLASVVPITWQV